MTEAESLSAGMAAGMAAGSPAVAAMAGMERGTESAGGCAGGIFTADEMFDAADAGTFCFWTVMSATMPAAVPVVLCSSTVQL